MAFYKHPDLGSFDAGQFGQAEKQIEWCGRPTKLILNPDGATLDQVAPHAIALMAKQRLWKAEIEDRIYKDLYSTWDESWRQDEPPLGKTDWLARIELRFVEVMPEGYFSAFHSDGGLFWDHSIDVFGSIGEGAKSANLFG